MYTKYNSYCDEIFLDAFSPLDQFKIRNLFGIEILDIKFAITSMDYTMTLAAFISIVLLLINNNFGKLISNKASSVKESIYQTVHSIVTSQIDANKGQMF